ncbi:hypothetical protein T439DRAFT_294088 [Meredithblackwellia eburnea MCA 4105]
MGLVPDLSDDEDGGQHNIPDVFKVGDGDEERGGEGGEDGEQEDDEDDFGPLVESQYAPQMRIVDGQLVIDDSSLEIDRHGMDEYNGTREVIEETAKDRMVNSSTWAKRTRVEKWAPEETALFFDCLSQFGTDFEMIAGLFPMRSRKQIKAKFNKEDKLNSQRITQALKRRKDIDLESYAKVTGQDLTGPVPEDPMEKITQLRIDIATKAAESGEPLFGEPGVALPSSALPGLGARGKAPSVGPSGAGRRGSISSVGGGPSSKGQGKKSKGKDKEREGSHADGDDVDDDGYTEELRARLRAIEEEGAVQEDEEDEEELERLREEAEAAAIDKEIAEAEEAERQALKEAKKKAKGKK